MSAVKMPRVVAPIASLAGFANMRINPGWLKSDMVHSDFNIKTSTGYGDTSPKASLCAAGTKASV